MQDVVFVRVWKTQTSSKDDAIYIYYVYRSTTGRRKEGRMSSHSFPYLPSFNTCCTHTNAYRSYLIILHNILSPCRKTINLFIAFQTFPQNTNKKNFLKFIYSACCCTFRANLISCDREREQFFRGNCFCWFLDEGRICWQMCWC